MPNFEGVLTFLLIIAAFLTIIIIVIWNFIAGLIWGKRCDKKCKCE